MNDDAFDARAMQIRALAIALQITTETIERLRPGFAAAANAKAKESWLEQDSAIAMNGEEGQELAQEIFDIAFLPSR